jgi:hypothetical protein
MFQQMYPLYEHTEDLKVLSQKAAYKMALLREAER